MWRRIKVKMRANKRWKSESQCVDPSGGGGLDWRWQFQCSALLAASWTCVLRSLGRRDWLTCGLLPNNALPCASGNGRAGPDTSICTTRAVRRPAMRPDPARLPVRPSTNDRQPMLLGPQRYAVVRDAICQRCEWYPVCAGLLAVVPARVPMLVRKTAGTRNAADRGVKVNLPHTRQPLASSSVLRCARACKTSTHYYCLPHPPRPADAC